MRGYPEHLHEVINEDLQESIYDESLEEMENSIAAPYFNESELDCLHNTVYNSIGIRLNNDELVNLVYTAPDNIRETGYEFGLCDTVFGDMMFAWLRQSYNKLEMGLQSKATTYSLMALMSEMKSDDIEKLLLKLYNKSISYLDEKF